MHSRRTARILIPLLSIPLIASGSSAQLIPDPGDILVSAIDSTTGLPDIFVITPAGLVGETGLLPSEMPTTVELSPVSPINDGTLELVVLDNGSGMMRFNYFGSGSNEGGPLYNSLINTALGFDSFDNPIVGFDNPIVSFDNPIVGFTPGILGLTHPMRANMPDFFEDPSFGFEDPSFGFEDPSFGFEDPSFGFTANSAIISYPTLDEEYELSISGGIVLAGLAYPRAWFIDPDEINAFDGIDGEAHRNYAGFAIFCNDGPSGPGMYLAPLDRASIESQTLSLQPFAVNGVFAGPFNVDGMHIDPVIPGTTYIWGTNGTARGTTPPVPTIYKIDINGTVSTLTSAGSIQSIDDLVVALDGNLYVLDSSTPQGAVIAIDTTTGAQTILATGGTVFNSASSLSIVQQPSKVIELNTTTDLADPTPGDGDYFNPGFLLTLRAVVEEANAQDIPHTIIMPNGSYDISTLGQLDITSDLTIFGSGADSTTITGSNASRIFSVAASGSLKLKGVTLDDGRANGGSGGAIQAFGPVAIEDVVISSGWAADEGGAIATSDTLHALRSHFVGNSANGDGGAIYTTGTTTIDRCSLFENEALNGGGIYVSNAAVDLINTTMYLNLSFWEGGAIRSQSNQPLRILHCTLLENEAGVFPNNPSAGGIDSSGSSAEPIIKSSVLAYNGFDGELSDVMGSFELADHSLLTTIDGATFGSLVSVMVGDNPTIHDIAIPLGVTYAFAPLPSSPIIDAAATDEFPAFDQLGYNRLIDGNGDTTPAPDMGAYEAPYPCSPDLNEDGTLDFFDVSLLISSNLDYNGDTAFDFFDISAFLQDFGNGCP